MKIPDRSYPATSHASNKFGSADKWFGFGLVFLPIAVTALVASLQPFARDWVWALRSGGLVAAAITLTLVTSGFFVWRHNLREASIATVVLAGTSSSESVRRAALSDQRDKLLIDKARLQPQLSGFPSALGRVSLSDHAAALKAQGDFQAAALETEQIDSKIHAINLELSQLARAALARVAGDK